MNAQIIFKTGKNVVVKSLQEIYVGRQKITEPYINLMVPASSLTFIGDIILCCNSDDVMTVIIR